MGEVVSRRMICVHMYIMCKHRGLCHLCICACVLVAAYVHYVCTHARVQATLPKRFSSRSIEQSHLNKHNQRPLQNYETKTTPQGKLTSTASKLLGFRLVSPPPIPAESGPSTETLLKLGEENLLFWLLSCSLLPSQPMAVEGLRQGLMEAGGAAQPTAV